jgi:GNAT superfamily N-acetyltransferase
MRNPAKAGSPAQPVRLRFAGVADCEALARLINTAFVVERPIFDGDRISADGVRAFLAKGRFLVADDSAGLAGCVYAEVQGDRGYIGLLSVEPSRQGSGLGRTLMEAAEEFFREAECTAAGLRVVSARTPLPAFYRHLGYVETHRDEVPADARPKIPCQFIYMSKTLERRS